MKKLKIIVFASFILLLTGGLMFTFAAPDNPGDGLQNGDLDRDRDSDPDPDHDCICDGSGECECLCHSPSDGEDSGDPNQGDGKRNRYGPSESPESEMAMVH